MRSGWRFIRDAVLRRDRLDDELSDEVQFHLDARAADLERRGLDAAEARRQARIEFGRVSHYQEECRTETKTRWWHEWSGDVRYALRLLKRSPLFTTVALTSLGLGIGANTFVFSVANSVMLRPLPVAEPARLFSLDENGTVSSYPNLRDEQKRVKQLSGITAYRFAPMDLDTGSQPARVWGFLAVGNYFDVLGIQPVLGRFFHASDDVGLNAHPYAVLSYACWQSRFGGDPGIVGRQIRINRSSFTIIGVGPREFHGTERLFHSELWVPLSMQPRIEGRGSWLEDRNTQNLLGLARLAPGATKQTAEAELKTVAAELARLYPGPNEGLRLELSEPGLLGGMARGAMHAFVGGVMLLAGLVLLAACANLCSLLLARAADRQREIGIRLSIGASRFRLLRQFLTEAMLIGAGGGLIGATIAAVLAPVVSAWAVPVEIPLGLNVAIDWRVLLFCCGISMIAALLVGLWPARQAVRTPPQTAIQGGAVEVRTRKVASRDVLVAFEVAVSVVLFAACLFSLSGLQSAMKMKLGFEPHGVAVASADLGIAGYNEERARGFQRNAVERLAGLPGVMSAAFASSTPLSLDQSTTAVRPYDADSNRKLEGRPSNFYEVSPHYFATMRTRLLSGRDFTWNDNGQSPRVAIINQTLARRLFGREDAVGQVLRRGKDGSPMRVVGIVEDGKYESLSERPKSVLFLPAGQSFNGTTVFLVRSHGATAQAVQQLRDLLRNLDPELTTYGEGGLDAVLGTALMPIRAAAIALSAFGLLALVLAATGIYGLVAYAVAKRLREIGIRVAIGASPAQVVWLVVSKMSYLIVGGVVVGVFLAFAASRVMGSIVLTSSGHDPVTLLEVAITMLLIGALCCWAPARRAMRLDAMPALRAD